MRQRQKSTICVSAVKQCFASAPEKHDLRQRRKTVLCVSARKARFTSATPRHGLRHGRVCKHQCSAVATKVFFKAADVACASAKKSSLRKRHTQVKDVLFVSATPPRASRVCHPSPCQNTSAISHHPFVSPLCPYTELAETAAATSQRQRPSPLWCALPVYTPRGSFRLGPLCPSLVRRPRGGASRPPRTRTPRAPRTHTPADPPARCPEPLPPATIGRRWHLLVDNTSASTSRTRAHRRQPVGQGRRDLHWAIMVESM